jgi:murein DD-endopeptidase MepM/ murein hydrolase activator NlpD
MKSLLLRVVVILFVSVSSHWAEPKVLVEDQQGGKVLFKVQNPNLCPETFTFRATLTNMACSKELPFTVEISPGATDEVCTFSPVDPTKGTNYHYKWNSEMGSVRAAHDDSAVYALPYPSGKSFVVSQGYGGDFSHTGEFRFAIDWKMPVGSAVCAARDGTVVKAKADSNEGGPTREFMKKANVVMILHDDGTIGEYVHLQQNGALVKVGDRVRAGDLIARSGNTGFSSTPHLHFHVMTPVDGTTFRSLPVKFRVGDGDAVTLTQGKKYPAP